MPTWRCPHCGTPQAETARCWVCHRSTTSCGTCRHFRRSVALPGLGYAGFCGLDRHRDPLHGDEQRACWESAVAGEEGEAILGVIAPLVERRSRVEVRGLRGLWDEPEA
ncbi:MAG TPA: hypothetical protein VF763_13155 [Candidatus Limnocylindrales bacterium]